MKSQITTREAAKILKTTPAKIRKLIYKTSLLANKIGTRWYLYTANVNGYKIGLGI